MSFVFFPENGVNVEEVFSFGVWFISFYRACATAFVKTFVQGIANSDILKQPYKVRSAERERDKIASQWLESPWTVF